VAFARGNGFVQVSPGADRPEATKERYGSVVTIKAEPDNKYVYEDGLFSGLFYVNTSRTNFTTTNKTDNSIKIIWDEAAFISTDGQPGRVAHEGVDYGDRDASQPPSVIPGGSSLTDFIRPISGVNYWSPLILPTQLWVAYGESASVDAFASEARKNKGKRFGLLLPLEIEGIVNDYTFWFEVQEVSVTQSFATPLSRKW